MRIYILRRWMIECDGEYEDVDGGVDGAADDGDDTAWRCCCCSCCRFEANTKSGAQTWAMAIAKRGQGFSHGLDPLMVTYLLITSLVAKILKIGSNFEALGLWV